MEDAIISNADRFAKFITLTNDVDKKYKTSEAHLDRLRDDLKSDSENTRRYAEEKLELMKNVKTLKITCFDDIEDLLDLVEQFFGSELVNLYITKKTYFGMPKMHVKKFDFRKLKYLRKLEMKCVILSAEIFNGFLNDKEYPILEKLECDISLDDLRKIELNSKSSGVKHCYEGGYFGMQLMHIEYVPANRLLLLAGNSFRHSKKPIPNADAIPSGCYDLLTALKDANF